MATRTIANGGGNWNSTATWVEGAVPTSADDVVATVTSGQLTVNVAATCRSLNLTNYANTLTMNNTLTLATASLTHTLGDTSTTYAGASNIICNVIATFVQNNTNRIPGLQFGFGTKTLNTDLYCSKMSINATITINGNKIYSNGNFGLLTQSSVPGASSIGTTEFVLDGSGLISHSCSNKITINTSGQYDTMGRGLIIGNGTPTGSAGELDFISGTTGVFNCILAKGVSGAATHTLNLNAPINLWIETKSTSTIGLGQMNVILSNPLVVDLIGSFTVDRLYTSDNTQMTVSFSGNSVSATTLNLKPAFRTTSSQTFPVASNGESFYSSNIKLDENYTHYFGDISLNGGSDKSTISSISSGVQVPIILGDKTMSQIINFDFTDVDASGGDQIVAINGTITNSTNVTNVYPSGGGGGGGGSFTFVN
jgi:hypothetical protein